MAWSTKTKIPQTFDIGYIVTPDGNNILVGSSEDEILIYREAGNNWGLKSKESAGSWNLKSKTSP